MADLNREPEWQGVGGPRVLIEAAEWSARQSMSQALQRAGFRTEVCPGPGGADHRCPLAGDGGCVAAEHADVVVHALHPGDHRNREALDALRRRLPDTPVVLDVPERARQLLTEDCDDCVVVPSPRSADTLVDAVRTAVAPSVRPSG